MASSNAPSYYFNNIDFNSSFFSSSSSSSGGMTQAQADLRYLIKAVSDSASFLETFDGGLTVYNSFTTDFLQISNVATIPGQIGWTQSSSGVPTRTLGPATGANVLWSFDTNGITTGTQLPIGIYLLTMCGTCSVPSGITAGTIVTYSAGYATGLTYSNAMTRTALISSNDANFGVMTKTQGVYPYSVSTVIKNLVPNNYIAGYMLVNFSVALTGGLYTLSMSSYSLTRIG